MYIILEEKCTVHCKRKSSW